MEKLLIALPTHVACRMTCYHCGAICSALQWYCRYTRIGTLGSASKASVFIGYDAVLSRTFILASSAMFWETHAWAMFFLKRKAFKTFILNVSA